MRGLTGYLILLGWRNAAQKAAAASSSATATGAGGDPGGVDNDAVGHAVYVSEAPILDFDGHGFHVGRKDGVVRIVDPPVDGVVFIKGGVSVNIIGGGDGGTSGKRSRNKADDYEKSRNNKLINIPSRIFSPRSRLMVLAFFIIRGRGEGGQNNPGRTWGSVFLYPYNPAFPSGLCRLKSRPGPLMPRRIQ